MEPRSSRLQQEVSREQKDCKQIESRLAALDASVLDTSHSIDMCHVRLVLVYDANIGVTLCCIFFTIS